MATGNSKKKYGLILASARRAQAAKSGGLGGVRKLNPLKDSDEELEEDEQQLQEGVEPESSSMDWVQAALKKSGGGNSAQLAQQQRLMREALEQDASVFQYDELFDGMQAERDTAKEVKKDHDRKPKYIHQILKCAERRKLEKERRTERKVQAEREAEKGQFDDKESFVTSSYLKKLDELKQAELKEKLEEMIEEKNDGAKDKNMGKFQRHLFKQRMGETTVKIEPAEGIPTTEVTETAEATGAVFEDTGSLLADVTIRRRDERSRGHQYRQQRDIDDSPMREDSSPKRRKTGDSDDSESDETSTTKPRSPSHRVMSGKKLPVSRRSKSPTAAGSMKKNKPSKVAGEENVKEEPLSSSEQDDNTPNDNKPKEELKKPKVETKETREDRIKKLFTKRTVGEIFIEAQQRYFLRKSERTA